MKPVKHRDSQDISIIKAYYKVHFTCNNDYKKKFENSVRKFSNKVVFDIINRFPGVNCYKPIKHYELEEIFISSSLLKC